MADRRRLMALAGLIAAAISLSTVVLASLVDPRFSWATRSLSSMGEATGTSLLALTSRDQIAWTLFNGGLVFGGLFGLPFAALLWADAKGQIEHVGVGFVGLTLVSMIGVGIAFLENDSGKETISAPFDEFHFLFATILFFSITLALWFYGSGHVKTGDVDFGLGAIWLGNVHVVSWVVWIMLEAFIFTDDGDTWTYFAVPEFIGAVAFGGFAAFLARRKLRAA